MQIPNSPIVDPVGCIPRKRGKLIRQKPPLEPKHVWAIRTRLQLARKNRDLALFNIAVDSKLRGCDVVRLKIEDIAPRGHCVEGAINRQRRTGRQVKFELTEQMRQAIDQRLENLYPAANGYLSPAKRGKTAI